MPTRSVTTTATLTGEKGEYYFIVPVDFQAVFGRHRPPVRVTIRGHTYRTTPARYGTEYFLVVNRANREAMGGLDHGDRVRIRIELDTDPRVVEPPPELAASLAGAPKARAIYRQALVQPPEGVRRLGGGGEAARDSRPPRGRIGQTPAWQAERSRTGEWVRMAPCDEHAEFDSRLIVGGRCAPAAAHRGLLAERIRTGLLARAIGQKRSAWAAWPTAASGASIATGTRSVRRGWA